MRIIDVNGPLTGTGEGVSDREGGLWIVNGLPCRDASTSPVRNPA